LVGKTINLPAPWLAAMVPLAYGAVLLLAPSGHGTLTYDELVSTLVVATPMMPNPAYLQPVTDPVFGTNFTQITDPGRPMPDGVPCESAYCTHRYSSSQAWNADQSLLMVVNDCNGFCFLATPSSRCFSNTGPINANGTPRILH
jgi:hypothetical protein